MTTVSVVAWIEEDLELKGSPQRPKGSLASGRFTAYLRTDKGEVAGPASVEAEDAIAWGRAKAPAVIVRVCDDFGGAAHFSAGAESPEEWQVGTLMPWPNGGLYEARELANHGPEAPARREADTYRVQLIALVRNSALSEALVGQITEWLGARDIEVERAETFRDLLDAGARSEAQTPETFWARMVSPAPAAMWTLAVTASNAKDAEATVLQAIAACADDQSAVALPDVVFRARTVP